MRWLDAGFVVVLAGAVASSSWLLGSTRLWAQMVVFALCAASFVLGTAVWIARRALGRPAAAWAGWWVSAIACVALVAFVAVQSLNVSHVPELAVNDSRLVPVPHRPFLPSSVGGPFDGLANGFIPIDNATRYLLIYGTVALGFLAAVLGARSRWCLRTLAMILGVHGLVSAVICIAHQWSGTTEVLWIQGDPMFFLGAPFFFYKNQNVAYQTLASAWSLGWLARMIERRTLNAAAASVLALVAIVGVASIRSRAGLVFALILAAGWTVSQRERVASAWRRHRTAVAASLVLAVMAASGLLWKTGAAGTIRRMAEENGIASTVLHGGGFRMLQHRMALAMFRDRPVFGWGAGSFIYVYSSYYDRVPGMPKEVPYYSYFRLGPHADGDWYEFLAELGIVGTGLFVLIWIPHLLLWGRTRIWALPAAFLPALGALLVLAHGFVDSILRNLAVLLALAVTSVLASRMTGGGVASDQQP